MKELTANADLRGKEVSKIKLSRAAIYGIKKQRFKMYKASILARDNCICKYCGKEGANSLDHIIPVCQIRLYVRNDNNICATHEHCNESKGDFFLGKGSHYSLDESQKYFVRSLQEKILKDDPYILRTTNNREFEKKQRSTRVVVQLSYLKIKKPGWVSMRDTNGDFVVL